MPAQKTTLTPFEDHLPWFSLKKRSFEVLGKPQEHPAFTFVDGEHHGHWKLFLHDFLRAKFGAVCKVLATARLWKFIGLENPGGISRQENIEKCSCRHELIGISPSPLEGFLWWTSQDEGTLSFWAVYWNLRKIDDDILNYCPIKIINSRFQSSVKNPLVNYRYSLIFISKKYGVIKWYFNSYCNSYRFLTTHIFHPSAPSSVRATEAWMLNTRAACCAPNSRTRAPFAAAPPSRKMRSSKSSSSRVVQRIVFFCLSLECVKPLFFTA